MGAMALCIIGLTWTTQCMCSPDSTGKSGVVRVEPGVSDGHDLALASEGDTPNDNVIRVVHVPFTHQDVSRNVVEQLVRTDLQDRLHVVDFGNPLQVPLL